jgi:bacitracin synthase 3
MMNYLGNMSRSEPGIPGIFIDISGLGTHRKLFDGRIGSSGNSILTYRESSRLSFAGNSKPGDSIKRYLWNEPDGCGEPSSQEELTMRSWKSSDGLELEVEATYPLTPIQKEMFLGSSANKEAYVMQYIFSIPADSDRELLKRTINHLMRKYEVLRSIFADESTIPGATEPIQVVLKQRELNVKFKDLSNLVPGTQENHVTEFKKCDRKRGFDLSCDQLLRAMVFITSGSSWKMVWTFHHIIMDGWSLPILLKEFGCVYESLRRGEAVDMEPVTTFRHYVDWVAARETRDGKVHWQNYLEGCIPQETLSTCCRHVCCGYYKMETLRMDFGNALSRSLKRLAQQHGVNEKTVFQTIWGILLQRYTSSYSGDVVFGDVVSERPGDVKGSERLVGLYMNVVPVRIKNEDGETVSQLLKKINEQSIRSEPFHHLHITEIVPRSDSDLPFIDTLMFYEDFPGLKDKPALSDTENDCGSVIGENDFSVTEEEEHELTGYDFNLHIQPGRDSFHLRISYNTLVYQEEFVLSIAKGVKEIATRFVANPTIEVKRIASVFSH